jgi:hypothetical protein
MPVLPFAYANVSTPLYETNQEPDPVQNILGSTGIAVSRVANNVTISTATPLIIPSADGTHTSTLATSNGGDLTISTAGPGVFNDMLLQPAGNLYLQPQGEFTQVGEGAEAGGGVLNITGTSGPSRVFDGTYNKPPGFQTITSLLNPVSNSPIAYNQLRTLAPGTYQLQLSAETITPQEDTRLRMICAGPEPASTVLNFSGASLGYDALLTSVFSLNSGYFTVGTAGNFRIIVESSGANWTADELNLQIVKIA